MFGPWPRWVTHNSQVVSSLLRDLRDLFYLVDGSNLRARLRPHPTLGPPGATESMRREGGEDEKRMLQLRKYHISSLHVVCSSCLVVRCHCFVYLRTCIILHILVHRSSFCICLKSFSIKNGFCLFICSLYERLVIYCTSYELLWFVIYHYLLCCYVHCNPNRRCVCVCVWHKTHHIHWVSCVVRPALHPLLQGQVTPRTPRESPSDTTWWRSRPKTYTVTLDKKLFARCWWFMVIPCCKHSRKRFGSSIEGVKGWAVPADTSLPMLELEKT